MYVYAQAHSCDYFGFSLFGDKKILIWSGENHTGIYTIYNIHPHITHRNNRNLGYFVVNGDKIDLLQCKQQLKHTHTR